MRVSVRPPRTAMHVFHHWRLVSQPEAYTAGLRKLFGDVMISVGIIGIEKGVGVFDYWPLLLRN